MERERDEGMKIVINHIFNFRTKKGKTIGWYIVNVWLASSALQNAAT